MPMLIPDHKTVPKTIANISKNGIDIDEVVRNSFSCAIRNSLTSSRAQKNSAVQSPRLTTTITNNNNNSNNILKNKNLNKATELRNSNIVINNSKMSIAIKNKHILKPPSRKFVNNNPSAKPYTKKNCLQQQKSGVANIPNHNSKNVKIKKEDCNLNDKSCELDDSLTSLQWLTDVKVNDLMEGKPIHNMPLSPAPSNGSEEGEDHHPNTGRTSRYYSDSSVDYRTNTLVKPPYSYAALIIMAMKSKACGKMTLSEIYKWITENFVFYKNADPSWQNSIRHNLSLNKCFAKLPRNKGDPGKGGYWRIVPEYADKLLETNIRKRRSSMIDYSFQELIKHQKLELFESQLLMKIKEEVKANCENNNNNTTTNSNQTNSYKNFYKHSSTPQQTVLADAEHCRMDHPYGKNPYAKYSSEEDNIKAIADNLQKISTAYIDPTLSTSASINFDLSNSQIFNTFSSVIRTDCIWSSEQNHTDNALTESMTRVKEELLEARNLTSEDNTLLSKTLTNSLNSSGGFTTLEFCLSPPLSGDDDTLSADDLDDDLDAPFEGLDLTIHGTSMQILSPTPEMIDADVKDEPLSPESIDLQEN